MKKIRKVVFARGFKKFVGIMFRNRVTVPLLFEFNKETRFENAIHSFFCPVFEAIFLDSGRRVVDIQRVKPFKLLVVSRKPCKYLIEAEEGFSKENGIKVGSEVFWEETLIKRVS